jgi:hypothetical protein
MGNQSSSGNLRQKIIPDKDAETEKNHMPTGILIFSVIIGSAVVAAFGLYLYLKYGPPRTYRIDNDFHTVGRFGTYISRVKPSISQYNRAMSG